ncbi:PEP-CTERM sorting domain-containing protein [Ideonella sp. BN130291]|uniref:PEP-CTERM sorting domain-containing protein n=1 Tax=Ideonella sp. BN130291 TaxID=3112940 RepID=UPI002E2637FA|nr:PEP-CTERM sorting domain-containing protein [Ideonella sp. BN130291]MED5621497.1 PEP-CTERM sorting domain-containing protein [Ideonella sp. BN130291]
MLSSRLRHAPAGIALALLAAIGPAHATIDLVPGTLNMFRDTRGANDVGVAQGDRFQFGADIVGGSLGVTLAALYPPTGFTVSRVACDPLAVNAGFCANSTVFNGGRLDPWRLTFQRGSDTLNVMGPALLGTESAVPFPVSVTLSGGGLHPTVSWTIPGGFAPNGFRINIRDKHQLTPSGQPDIIHSVAIAPSATSYTIPSLLSSGQQLAFGGQYSINLQLIETRGHVDFTGNNAEILRRSSSFFNFTPLSGDQPPDVALPTVVNGVYNFHVLNVGPASTTFIDPVVAVGYDYAVGAGDPNFGSVLLPNVGDGNFLLQYTLNGSTVQTTLAHDTQFFFPQGGVGAFRVSEIEASAGLDPGNTTAFITGLTFAANGDFTGTMTPITLLVPVPEPSSVALLLTGLLATGGVSRRRRSR